MRRTTSISVDVGRAHPTILVSQKCEETRCAARQVDIPTYRSRIAKGRSVTGRAWLVVPC